MAKADTRAIYGGKIALFVSQQERDTILAALRVYQHWNQGTRPDPEGIADIATNGDRHDGMTLEEIDILCEEINV